MNKIMLSILVFFVSASAYAVSDNDKQIKKEPVAVTLKFATLAPPNTYATEAIRSMQKCFDVVGPRLGVKIKMIGYYGGAMGDDPQMIQKAKLGQLDMLATTLNGLPLIAKEFEVFNMAYLIEDFGMFDYVMRKNSAYINKLFYDNGWISLGLLMSEGQHDLYLGKPLKKAEDLKKYILAVNYTGGPDDTFFKALGVSQKYISPTEIYLSVKNGNINASLLPSAFVMGMQIYTVMPYIIKPSVRISTSALVMTRSAWEKLPIEFKMYLAITQPAICYGGAGIMRDASYAFTDAMLRTYLKQIKLSDAEYKEWYKHVEAYRKIFLGKDKSKIELYNKIVEAIKEYKTGNPIEKRIYESDPTYRNFPDKLYRIGEALYRYMSNRDLTIVSNLERDAILEKWRVYDMMIAVMQYNKKGDYSKSYEWMKSFYIPDFVDEIFTKHINVFKRLYADEKSYNDRMLEAIETYKISQGMYKGYQKTGIKSSK